MVIVGGRILHDCGVSIVGDAGEVGAGVAIWIASGVDGGRRMGSGGFGIGGHGADSRQGWGATYPEMVLAGLFNIRVRRDMGFVPNKNKKPVKEAEEPPQRGSPRHKRILCIPFQLEVIKIIRLSLKTRRHESPFSPADDSA